MADDASENQERIYFRPAEADIDAVLDALEEQYRASLRQRGEVPPEERFSDAPTAENP